ncbi:DNA repair protein RecO [Microbacterium sp. YY-01]|uniref:DNA repair protein RecO n=1 Tax=Microbacterium sp. YY-01 TaxID=3421634 RepID=UPI003D1673C4
MPTYRDEAVVLRTHKLGEADRIVTLLTRNYGRVRAVAKGVRRTSSKFGARLEPFMVADVQLYEGRSLDIVQQAVSLASYGATIAAHYDRFTAANAMVETADRIAEAEATPQHYLLLIGALRALSRGDHASRAILDSYLLRIMAISGWAPALDDCARCGASGTQQFFAAAMGGAVCASCAPAGSPRMDYDSNRMLQALLAGEWDYVDAAQPAVAHRASGLVAAYAQWHMERGIRSLAHIEGAQ